MHLENVEILLGKVRGMMQTFMTNSNFYIVQNLPCSMCISRNHADEECVENSKENAWSYVPAYIS